MIFLRDSPIERAASARIFSYWHGVADIRRAGFRGMLGGRCDEELRDQGSSFEVARFSLLGTAEAEAELRCDLNAWDGVNAGSVS